MVESGVDLALVELGAFVYPRILRVKISDPAFVARLDGEVGFGGRVMNRVRTNIFDI